MDRRTFCAALAGGTLLPGADAANRPNIVYILADDLGWGDLGCYNPESQIPTPHADRLAQQGVRFTDMHSPSAVCTPTRYGVLTGRYCWRSSLHNGVLWGYSPNLIEKGRITAASLLRAQGYYTAGIGKWHLGLGDRPRTDYSQPLRPGPREHGFNYFFGIPASLDMDPYLYFENDRVVEAPSQHIAGNTEPRGVMWRTGLKSPGFEMDQVLPTLTQRAVSVIQERGRNPRKPFYLYLPLTGPHTPWLPTGTFRGKTKAGLYGDFAAQVDGAVGEILRALDSAKLSANTLVILTSDNGAHWTPQDKEKFAHRANASWRGMKADVWEAGHRVPFLARWPGMVPANSICDDLGCLTDFLATAGEIAGAAVPANAAEDSFSLLAALTGKTDRSRREAVVHHSMDGMFAIRKGNWKLAVGRGSGGFSAPKREQILPGDLAGQLYDLKNDPGESRNLYDRHPSIVSELRTLLEQYRSTGRSVKAAS